MGEERKRIMIIGLDAAIAPRLHRYAMEGHLPALKSLIERGVYAENCLVPYPTITSSNWTTIATGAWPGTHGITGYSVHLPGDELDALHDGFNSVDRTAETIWEAAERAGRKSVVFDWPAAWPPRTDSGIFIGGGGVGVNSWRVPHNNQRRGVTLGSYQIFSIEELPLGQRIEFSPASPWADLDQDLRALEATVELHYDAPPEPAANDIEPKEWHILLVGGAEGYDRVLISETKDASNAFADLRVGQWSGTVLQDFQTSAGTRRGCFKCKLLGLSPDASRFRLYVSIINALGGWSMPSEAASSIRSQEGLPSPRDGYMPYLLGWIDRDTLAELAEFQHTWIADAVECLLSDGDWDLFLLHAHCPDWMYHTFSRELDPLTNHDPRTLADHVELELQLYGSLDTMIGRLLELADENTIVVVTSDHGAKASNRRFKVGDLLAERGLTVYMEGVVGPAGDPHGAVRDRQIDWSKTKAYAQRACYIYVNTKGRDPHGIVEPGRQYEEVRDSILSILTSYTDPETGRKPIALALKREDARLLGLYGDRVGDIIYALNPEFGGEHGNFLPTAEWGIGSMRGLLIMAGPGIARGRKLERTIWLTDIAPTLCHLAEIPVPRQAEGAVIYQALEDPDLRLKELRRIRQDYHRVLRAFSSEEAETHRHGT